MSDGKKANPHPQDGDRGLEGMMAMVERFNVEVLGVPVPKAPTTIDFSRAEWKMGHVHEEMGEFLEATHAADVAEAADAIVDLVYVALGCLVEMGVAPSSVFTEVHRKNMQKRRGENAKRPDSGGFDAVKPEGWTPPDHSWLSEARMEDWHVVRAAVESRRTGATVRVEPVITGDAFMQALPPIEGKYHGLNRPAETEVAVTAIPYVLAEIIELRRQKGNDYNTSVKLEDYFPFGHFSYAQMVHVKNLRVRSLLEVLKQGKEPKFEGLRDTLLDLLNYTCYYVEALDRNFGPAVGTEAIDGASGIVKK